MSKAILFAYEFDGKGNGTPLFDDDISAQIRGKELAWVHLDALHGDAFDWLKNEVSYLDPYIVNALLAEETRPRVTEIGDGMLVILRGANLNPDASPEDMVSIRLWIDPHRIISVQRRPLRAVKDIRDKIEQNKAPTDAAHFLSLLIAGLFERMEPVLGALEDGADNLEEQVLEHADSSMRESVIDLRRQALIFKRYLTPQRDAIAQIRTSDLPWVLATHKRHLQESIDRVSRFLENLDALRERSQIIKEELDTTLTDRLNKNMYTLSVIAAIFLPLGFLTGLLGINVGGIPGSDTPYAFAFFCGILIFIVTLQVILFKKLKWF